MPPKKATPAKKATPSSKAKLVANARAKANGKGSKSFEIGGPWGGKPKVGLPVRGGGGMFPGTRPGGMKYRNPKVDALKNQQDWKAIGGLVDAYKSWLGGLAKQNAKPVRGGGGMAPGKKAKKR